LGLLVKVATEKLAMLKNPYTAKTDRYPVEKLPRELLGDIEPKGLVRVIVQRLDDEGQIVAGHPFLDRDAGETASTEDIVDYVNWVRSGGLTQRAQGVVRWLRQRESRHTRP
jgi:hypothetical protein